MSLYEPGMAMMWTSQGSWLVQMTAGQIIASSAPQCQFNSIGRKKKKKKQIQPKLNLDSLDETTTQQQLQASLGESLQQETPWWHRRALESVKVYHPCYQQTHSWVQVQKTGLQGDLTPVNNRQSSCTCSCKPTTTTVWDSTPRITMWLPPIQRYSRHDIHCTATPRKMLRTKAAFIYGFYLTKAFDMVDRQALWSILSRYGCHDKYIRILRLLRDGMEVTVLSNGGTKSEPFTVETGVKQGCVIAPTLFVIFIAAILHLIGEELPQRIPIMYRTNGRLFNLNRFKAKRKVNCTKITELKYADDNVIAAHSAKDLQGILNAFAKANRALGLKLNIKKTQFLHQSPPYELAIQPSIKVDNTTLEYVDHLPYVDSILSSKADKRLTIAWFVPVEPTPGSGEKSLKLKTYQPKQYFWSTELSSSPPCCVELSHGPPTAGIWEPWNNTIKRSFRKILRISWKDRRTNINILEEANMTSITTTIMQHKLRWMGHVIRMPNTRLPKQILYSQLKEGSRATDEQKKRYKDNIKAILKKFHITTSNWENIALDRSSWKKSVQDGAANHGIELHHATEIKRQLHKEKNKKAQPISTITTLSCPHCTKVCGSRIGPTAIWSPTSKLKSEDSHTRFEWPLQYKLYILYKTASLVYFSLVYYVCMCAEPSLADAGPSAS